jgi:sulfate adenylyltransferase subunit 2
MFIYVNPESVKRNIDPFVDGSRIHKDIMKAQTLKQALNQHKFDVAFSGARRDEENSKAKGRVLSFHNAEHHCDATNRN